MKTDFHSHLIRIQLRELECLQLYLSIEEVRFQDRMRVEISADPAILDAGVPHRGLQPIVENAIRHGIGRSSAAVQISAFRENGTLVVKVKDDGPAGPEELDCRTPGHGSVRTWKSRSESSNAWSQAAHRR